MTRNRRGAFGAAITIAAVSALLAAGCSKPDAPAGGPVGGMGGGPGGRMGGPGGGMGPGARVAENASAAEIFQQKCQFCHGAQGAGGSGPSLTGAAGQPNAALRTVIHDGRRKMPAFGTQMTAAQLDAVVAHVKQLGK